ncbi:MAG TPA: GNAT family N-acetyltransferase [Candidatus Udaeobacter sp.]|nr:GNAT family N-acetyltransferase [Candidatus Udaeobacter sp.]
MAERSNIFTIRLATNADIPALRELIDKSVRVLQREDYSAEQLDAALGTAYGVDTQLITDGTYYAVEAVRAVGDTVLAACGGWSMRKTLYGSDHGPYRDNAMLDPACDAARIRAFFVHPEWTRRGIASLILKTCEDAAYERGFRRFEMGATLTGVPMYAARGYAKGEQIEVPLPNGMSLTVVRMSKTLV